MSQFHKKNLKPLSEGEPVYGLMPGKMSSGSHLSDEELRSLADEAYATPRGMLNGLLWGFLFWGLIGFVVWIYMAVTG